MGSFSPTSTKQNTATATLWIQTPLTQFQSIRKVIKEVIKREGQDILDPTKPTIKLVQLYMHQSQRFLNRTQSVQNSYPIAKAYEAHPIL